MRRRSIQVACTLLLAAAAAHRAGAAPAAGPSSSVLSALDYAFRFAAAIKSDPNDQAMAEHGVVLEYASLGALDEAIRRAEVIPRWRRGAAFASLAVDLARAGRAAEAKELLGRAESVRAATSGWEGPRIAAGIAEGWAALGDERMAEAIDSPLAYADPTYAARAAATAAVARAAAGSFDEAMQRLASLDGATDFEALWWQTDGFQRLARVTGLTGSQRRRALVAARAAAARVPGWKQAEALVTISEEYLTLGDAAAAQEVLEAAAALAVGYDDATPVKGRLLASVARGCAEAGDAERARSLLLHASPAVHAGMEIDRPGIQAEIAAGWQVIGEPDQARREFLAALDAAAALRNARPRALAAVQIGRALARSGLGAQGAVAGRLETLLRGLGDPW
jgi:hypothetical protein